MILPKVLQNPNFRFALAGKNMKIPIEKSWNKLNCYPFFEEKLRRHRGNYIICTGFGNLIVLDFDDRDYYNSVVGKLPPTFTVLSAGKKLPHLYYILTDSMIKKKAINGHDKRTLCDIQASGCGVICPGSSIERRYYTVVNDREISNISLEELKTVFKFKPVTPSEYKGSTENNPKKVKETILFLRENNVKQVKVRHFQCPLHNMSGKGNLWVDDSGSLHCFHCNFNGTGEELIKRK